MKGQLYFDLREIMTSPFTRVWMCEQSSWLPLCWWLWLFTQYISDVVKVKRESDRTLSSGEPGRPLLTLRLGADCQLWHTCGSPAFLGLGFVFCFFPTDLKDFLETSCQLNYLSGEGKIGRVELEVYRVDRLQTASAVFTSRLTWALLNYRLEYEITLLPYIPR